MKVNFYGRTAENSSLLHKASIAAVCNFHGTDTLKRGREYSGLCPFHSDNHLSLSIDDERGLFFCFACGAKGDAITLGHQFTGASELFSIIAPRPEAGKEEQNQ